MGTMAAAVSGVESIPRTSDRLADAAMPATAGAKVTADGIVKRLQGVPKGALKTVLGKDLGARAWRQARGNAAEGEAEVSDNEVAAGLIGHLSKRAAYELLRSNRQGKFVRLTAWYQDGGSESGRIRLAGLTQDAGDLFEGAHELFMSFVRPAGHLSSLNLDVTAAADTAVEPSRAPEWLALQVRATAG